MAGVPFPKSSAGAAIKSGAAAMHFPGVVHSEI